MRVLVTGATGYIASRLIPGLLERGFEVRATSRHPGAVAARHPEAEVITSDLLDEASLAKALNGTDVAFYLVHAMSGRGFEDKDRRSASNFIRAAERAGVERIVYLGGLGEQDDSLSAHLRSRHEVGKILAGGDVRCIELRAAIVIGSGSAAFEMLRHLTEKLPAMIAPRWLSTRIQPLGEKDLVRYLCAAAEVELNGDRVVEIGGRDVLTYSQMIGIYARHRGLRRMILGVPVLTPRLSSYWVDLVTPIPSSVAHPLIDGLKNEVIVRDDDATRLFPEIEPRGYSEAVEDALSAQVRFLETATRPGEPPASGALAGIKVDRQWMSSTAAASTLGRVVGSIGGEAGWYPLRWAWWVRARLDDLFGGAGLRWQRPEGGLKEGARVDWWTVQEVDNERLLLKAEMRVPGEAWLEWRVVPRQGTSELRQTAYFRPRGVAGRLYWYLLYPFHAPIFRLMAYRLARRAEGRPSKGGGGLLEWARWELRGLERRAGKRKR